MGVALFRCREVDMNARKLIARADDVETGVDDGVVLLTFAEAERRLRLSRMTLHNLIVAGELRVRRIGRAVRIPISEVKRLGTPGVTSTQ
jgi:excisionase family DNA binding protein